jgi:hypothetical protein
MDMLAAAALMVLRHQVAVAVAAEVEHLLAHLRQIVERVD